MRARVRGVGIVAACAAAILWPRAAEADACTDLLQGIFKPANEPTTGGQGGQLPDQNLSCYIVNSQAQNASIFSFDYGVPHSPALMLAGLSTDKVTPATSLKPFVLSLPGLIGSGSTNTSAALDFAPAWAWSDKTDTLHYGDDTPEAMINRIWFRTRLSAALSKGDSGGTDTTKAIPSRAAIGLNVSLLDGSDPVVARMPGEQRSHWLQCLIDHRDAIKPYPPADVATFKKLNAAVLAVLDLEQTTPQLHNKIGRAHA